MILIWPLLRMLGLRAASWGLAGLMSPWVVGGVLAVGMFVWWSDHQFDAGRDQERASTARVSAEAEGEALKTAIETVEEHGRKEVVDNNELAVTAAKETKVRDDNPGDDVLWRSDDGWLRAKRSAEGRR